MWACYFWNRAKTKQRITNVAKKVKNGGKRTLRHKMKSEGDDAFAPPREGHDEHADLFEPRGTSMDILLHPSRT